MNSELDPQQLRAVVARASCHDPDAWEQLYLHCRPRLLRYARRRLSTMQEAEDAVSDTLLRAIERIETFTWQGGGFDAWMYGILRNVLSETYRRAGRSDRLRQRGRSEIDLTVARPEPPPTERLEAAEDAAILRSAFSRLSGPDQDLLEMLVVGGISTEEVAMVLGKKPGTVRMARSRALDRLRHAWRSCDDA